MSIADRIRERTSAKHHIDVAEWGEDGAPQRVFYGPLLTGEISKLQRKHPQFLTNMDMAGAVELIVMKAENGEGEKLFTLEDKPLLMREEVHVITRVAAAFMSGVQGVEELEKN